eukprot:SAG31_NODE_81_length_27131_cov_4.775283_8_plen_430_part_00
MVFLAHGRHPWSSPALLLLFAMQATEFRATTASLATSAACNGGADIARAAQQLCGDVAIEEALRLVRLQPETVRTLQPVFTSLGLRTVLDLQLLAGGPDATALMQFISKSDLANIGELAKIRLLVGDQEHLSRIASVEKRGHEDEHQPPNRRPSSGHSQERRWLQEQADGGMSMDTVAIVLSLLVGAAGYIVVSAGTQDRSLSSGLLPTVPSLCTEPNLDNVQQAVSARHAERAAEASAQELQVWTNTSYAAPIDIIVISDLVAWCRSLKHAGSASTSKCSCRYSAPNELSTSAARRQSEGCTRTFLTAVTLQQKLVMRSRSRTLRSLRRCGHLHRACTTWKKMGPSSVRHQVTMFHGTPSPAVVRGATTFMKGCPSTKSTGTFPVTIGPIMTHPRKTQHCMIMSFAEVGVRPFRIVLIAQLGFVQSRK